MSESDDHQQREVSPDSDAATTTASGHRIKKYAVIISVLALVPSAASAAAALMAWRTAQASLELAHSVADESGAKLEIDDTILFKGGCESPDRPLVAAVGVRNAGHLPGGVTGLAVFLRSPRVSEYGYSKAIVSGHFDPVINVEPQSITYIDLQVTCNNLPAEFRYIGKNTLGELIDSVNDHGDTWTVLPEYAVANNRIEPQHISLALIHSGA
ncbi:hypothetical protein [Mycobacterium sp.]|uniref:hypothetical protein n=1 Tax=Mycobacterium sp. TaxID=1785 RepID=UPI002D84FBF7|nr:hypothetical protein [Mycobacterium sp.]